MVQAFIKEWENGEATVDVYTSGSTGEPKLMHAEKWRMRNSALMTLRFLGIKSGETALLCMPMRYIAAKMMVVRALVGGLRLIEVKPSSHPLKGLTEAPDFAAMTPMQVRQTLNDAEERALFARIRNVIIGGGPVDQALANELRGFEGNIFSTYGMTETLSHVAMRRLSGADASDAYTPLDGVSISLSEQGTLVISAPNVCHDTLVTNDLADIRQDGAFRILGRTDNIINTGGIKVSAEEIEAELMPYIDVPFVVTSSADELLGEAVTIIAEGAVSDSAFQHISPYHRPRRIIIGSVPLTETGKPDRRKARMIARSR